MKSRSRVMALVVGVAAAAAALLFFVRPEQRREESSPPRERVKASDRVRMRLEQLRAQHPGWNKGDDLQARAPVPAAQERRPRRPDVAPQAAAQADAAPERDSGDAAPAPFDEDPDDIPMMKKIALEDPDPDRRVAAITMLGASEASEAIPVLAKALSDQNEEVRMAALETLSDFTDEPPVEAIESALSDPSGDIRFEALSVLADVGGERARAAIEGALNDPDEDVHNLAEGILDLENLYEPPPAGTDIPPQPEPE